MTSIGIAMIAIGIGSLVMRNMGQQYIFLEWAEGMQPAFGIVLAVLGVVVAATGAILRLRKPR